jgi:uncharacterized protein (TIGR03437 family)
VTSSNSSGTFELTGYSSSPGGTLSPIPSPISLVSGLNDLVATPSGQYVYLVYGGTPTPFGVNPVTGALSAVPNWPAFVGATVSSLAIDPSGSFLYGGTTGGVFGWSINPATAALVPIAGGPFRSTYQPNLGPQSIVTTSSGYLYVSTFSLNTALSGYIEGYAINRGTGAVQKVLNQAGPDNGLCLMEASPNGNYLYATAYNGIFAYRIDPGTGNLTPLPGSPFPANYPNGISIDSSGRFLYAASFFNNDVYGWAINSATGTLTVIPGSPFAAGLEPTDSVVDPTGKFIYVTNQNSNTISAYSISSSTGVLTPVPGNPFASPPAPTLLGVGPLPVNHLLASLPDTATAGVPLLVVANAQDRLGNPPVKYVDPLSFQSTDAKGLFPVGATLTNGTGAFEVTFKTAAIQTLTIADPAYPNLTVTQTVNVAAGPTAQFSFSTPATATSGALFNFVVSAQDAFANPTPSYTGQIAFSSSDQAAVLPGPSYLLNGVRSFSATLNTPGAQTITVQDTLMPSIAAVSKPIAIPAGPATHFIVAAPSGVGTTTTFSFAVTALDKSDAIAISNQDTVHFTSSDPNAILPQDSKLTAGAGTFSATFETAGNQNIAVVDITTGGIQGVSGLISVTQTPGTAALMNAASLAGGAAAPNTILTAFGSFPGCQNGAEVFVDRTSVAVFYASATQINFLLPSTVANEAEASIQFSCAGVVTPAQQLKIVQAAPALFTAAASGVGQVAAVNQDNTVDTPSPAGRVIQLYGIGFGALAATGADGLARLLLPVSATVGGAPATILFAGQAPGFTTGLQQINLLVPAGTPSSNATQLVVTAGGFSTQSNVTVAIQ